MSETAKGFVGPELKRPTRMRLQMMAQKKSSRALRREVEVSVK
jgi:hypothetical protein